MASRTSSPILRYLQEIAIGGLLTVRIDGTPSPSHRPRVARNGGVFYAKGYTEWHRACQEGIAAGRPWGAPDNGPLEGPLGVVLDIAMQHPKATKLVMPRGDVDNHAKAPLDAAKTLLWLDDGQVGGMWVQKRWTVPGEAPGASMWTCPIDVSRVSIPLAL